MAGLPVVRAARISEDFVPTGRLTHREWERAEVAHIGRRAQDGRPAPELATSLRVLWSSTSLYLGYQAPYTALTVFEHEGPGERRVGLWERDVLEAFLGVDSSRPEYYAEFEWAPNGDWIDVAVALPEKDMEWDGNAQFCTHVDEATKTWTVEVRIPLPITVQGIQSGPPVVGDRWRANFFRFDYANDAYLAFSPTMVEPASFHVPEKFGYIEFCP